MGGVIVLLCRAVSGVNTGDKKRLLCTAPGAYEPHADRFPPSGTRKDAIERDLVTTTLWHGACSLLDPNGDVTNRSASIRWGSQIDVKESYRNHISEQSAEFPYGKPS
jgi:hypothetical protein